MDDRTSAQRRTTWVPGRLEIHALVCIGPSLHAALPKVASPPISGALLLRFTSKHLRTSSISRHLQNINHHSSIPVFQRSREHFSWTATATTDMATTLPRFKEFPTEVQLKIWKKAIPGPRIVDFRLGRLKATPKEWYSTESVLDESDPRMKSVCLFSRLLFVFLLIHMCRKLLNIPFHSKVSSKCVTKHDKFRPLIAL